VENDEVVAGLVSGVPDPTRHLNVFSSGQISVRSMFVKKGNGVTVSSYCNTVVLKKKWVLPYELGDNDFQGRRRQ
jgi:hypothetical protein